MLNPNSGNWVPLSFKKLKNFLQKSHPKIVSLWRKNVWCLNQRLSFFKKIQRKLAILDILMKFSAKTTQLVVYRYTPPQLHWYLNSLESFKPFWTKNSFVSHFHFCTKLHFQAWSRSRWHFRYLIAFHFLVPNFSHFLCVSKTVLAKVSSLVCRAEDCFIVFLKRSNDFPLEKRTKLLWEFPYFW